jgi:hypothetical protein
MELARGVAHRVSVTVAVVLAGTLLLAVAMTMAGCAGRPPGPTGKTDQGQSIMDKLYVQIRKDFAALKAGKAEDVYEDTASQLKASKTAKEFADSVAAQPIYTSWTKYGIEGDKTHTVGAAKPGTEGAVVALTVDLSKGAEAPAKFDVQYVFEKGQWRLASLVPSAGMQQN